MKTEILIKPSSSPCGVTCFVSWDRLIREHLPAMIGEKPDEYVSKLVVDDSGIIAILEQKDSAE